MTNKQVRYTKAVWTKALREARIIKFDDGRLVLYPTIPDRDAALKLALAIGARAEIVYVEPDKS